MANVVKIVVDAVDKTKKGLTTPIKSVKDLRAAVDNLKPAFVAAASAAAAAFAVMARQQINVLDQTAKLSQKLGVSTETLSTMTHASNLAGTSMEGLRMAFKTLGQRVVDAQRGMKSATDDFDALGISVTDSNGKVKDSEALFLEIADAVAKMDDGLEKAGIASKLLGRQGLELIPLLNAGAGGIKAMQEEARALGLEIDSNTAKQAEKFNDDLVRLNGAMTGLTRSVLNEMLPSLIEVTESFVSSAKESGVFEGAAKTISDVLLGVGRAASTVAALFKLMGGILAAEADFITQIFVGIGKTVQVSLSGIREAFKLTAIAANNASVGEFGRAADFLAQAGEKISEGFKGIGPESLKQFEILKQNSKSAVEGIEADAQRVRDAFMGVSKGIQGQGSKASGGATQTGAEGSSGGVSAFAAKVTAQYNQITKTKLELINIEHEAQKEAARKEVEDFSERLRVMAELAVIYHAKRQEIRDEDLAREAEANEFIKALNEQAQLGQLDWMAQERQIAEDDHQRNLERILEIGASEAKQREMQQAAEAAHQARLVKIQEDADRQKIQLRLRVYDAWADAFGAMANVSAAFFGRESAAAKAFAITEAIINTYRAANQVLADPSLPFFLKIPAMITTIGTGLANVASISGVAHGGIAEVPSDQTFLLKKGERVLSPDQNSDFVDFMEGGGGGASNIELTINLDGDPLWRGLAKASRDGRATISARAIV